VCGLNDQEKCIWSLDNRVEVYVGTNTNQERCMLGDG
jgi:hypothetical protein